MNIYIIYNNICYIYINGKNMYKLVNIGELLENSIHRAQGKNKLKK